MLHLLQCQPITATAPGAMTPSHSVLPGRELGEESVGTTYGFTLHFLLIHSSFMFTCHSIKGILRIAIYSLNLDLELTSLYLPHYAEGVLLNGFRFCNPVAGSLPSWAVVTTRHESWYRKSAQRRISRSALQRFLQGTYLCLCLCDAYNNYAPLNSLADLISGEQHRSETALHQQG